MSTFWTAKNDKKRLTDDLSDIPDKKQIMEDGPGKEMVSWPLRTITKADPDVHKVKGAIS
jgi:hypothetical protein